MTDVIAWAALLFSGISLILSVRTKRSQDQLIARQIEAHDRQAEESGRAHVTAGISKRPGISGSTQFKVVIRNNGPATARNVQLTFPDQQQLVPSSELVRKLPLAVLAAGDEIELIASAAMGMPSKYDIILEWEDATPRSEPRVLVV